MSSLQNSIEGYISDAKDWYGSKYLYPYTQSCYVLIACILLFSGALASLDITLRNYATKKAPFPMYAIDETKYKYVLRTIASKEEDGIAAIGRYMVTKYVKLWESYDSKLLEPEALKNRENLLSNLSSQAVGAKFRKHISLDNKKSPIFAYGFNETRDVEVMSVEFNPYNHKPRAANVYFKTLVYDTNSTIPIVEHWKAKVEFVISALTDKTKIRFIVSNYEVEQIPLEVK